MTAGPAVRRLLDRLDGVRQTSGGWLAICPCHDDKSPSLNVRQGDDRALVFCHPCQAKGDDVCRALDLPVAALYDDYDPSTTSRGRAANRKNATAVNFNDALASAAAAGPGTLDAALKYMLDAALEDSGNGAKTSPDDAIAAVREWLGFEDTERPDIGVMVPWLAQLTELDYEQIRVDVARLGNVRVGKLDQVVMAARSAAKNGGARQEAPQVDPEKLLEAAEEILNASDQLVLFRKRLRGVFAGATDAVELLHLAFLSRNLERPINVAVSGPSAAGKSFAVDAAMMFHPPEKVHDLTGMSERALVYSTRDFRHSFVVIHEVDGIHEDGIGASLIRKLSWSKADAGITYDTVVKVDGEMVVREIEIPGPTGLVTTTTTAVERQLATRMIEVIVTDSPRQTADVVRCIAQQAVSGESINDIDVSDFQAASRWLEVAGERRVAVPFAPQLAAHVPVDTVRMRRDFEQILSVVKAHAFAHQLTREKTDKGAIVATREDYAAAHRLLQAVLSIALDDVTDAMRETVAAVAELEEASYTELADRLGLAKSTVHGRCRRAIKSGYLVNTEQRKGYPAHIALGDPLPAPRAVIPGPDEIEFDDTPLQPPRDSDERPNTSAETPASTDVEGVRVGVRPPTEQPEHPNGTEHLPERSKPAPVKGYSGSVRPFGENGEGSDGEGASDPERFDGMSWREQRAARLAEIRDRGGDL